LFRNGRLLVSRPQWCALAGSFQRSPSSDCDSRSSRVAALPFGTRVYWMDRASSQAKQLSQSSLEFCKSPGGLGAVRIPTGDVKRIRWRPSDDSRKCVAAQQRQLPANTLQEGILLLNRSAQSSVAAGRVADSGKAGRTRGEMDQIQQDWPRLLIPRRSSAPATEPGFSQYSESAGTDPRPQLLPPCRRPVEEQLRPGHFQGCQAPVIPFSSC
jgi:hypothetical protein